MDLLERARTLTACPLFENLAPAVVIRLAERTRAVELARGERRTTDDTVWVIASGTLAVAVRGELDGRDLGPAGSAAEGRRGSADATASIVRKRGGAATAGHVLGVIRVVRPATPAIDLVAEEPSVLVGLAFDDVRDVLDEDPAAQAALAALLLGEAP